MNTDAFCFAARLTGIQVADTTRWSTSGLLKLATDISIHSALDAHINPLIWNQPSFSQTTRPRSHSSLPLAIPLSTGFSLAEDLRHWNRYNHVSNKTKEETQDIQVRGSPLDLSMFSCLHFIREGLSEPPLKIVVGTNDQRTSYVNKAIICSLSDFFAAACKKEWVSGQTNTVTLPEEDPAPFALFVTWILTKGLDNAEELQELMPRNDPNYGKDKAHSNIERRAQQLVPCIGLADLFLCYEFHNAVMDEILRLADESQELQICLLSTGKAVKLVYQHSQAGSKLRQFHSDICFTLAKDSIDVLIRNCSDHAEFLSDFLSVTYKRLKENDQTLPNFPLSASPCKYHIHPDQAESYTCTIPNSKKT